jgi:hypothetical protein
MGTALRSLWFSVSCLALGACGTTDCEVGSKFDLALVTSRIERGVT